MEILVILQFLEGARGKYCEQYKKNYKKSFLSELFD